MRDFESFIKKYITNSERRHKYVAAVTSLALLVSFAVPMILTEPAVSTTINTFGDLGGILPEQLFYDGIPANSVENIAKRDGNTVNNVVYSPQYMSVAELLIGTGDNPTHRWATGLTTASSISKAAQREYFLGIASDFCVFVEEDFKPKESDAEGRVAVGRNFIFEKDSPDGNYQIGAGDFESGTALKDTDNYEGLSGFAHAIIGGNIMKRLALYTTKHIGDENSDNYELADADKDRYKRIVVGSNFDFDESKHAAISGNSHPLVEYDNSDGHKHFYRKWADTMDATDEKAQIYKTTTEEPLIDFKEEFKFLRKQATALSEIEAITGTLNGGELTFTGPGNEATDKVVYFKINSWSDDITSIRFDGIPPKANIVVSCPADDFKFGLTHTYINGSDIAKLRADKGGLSANNHPDSERILYNFYSATTGHIKDNANGTVFAPYADVTGNQCHLSGSLIAKSFSGTTEFGYRPYRGPASIVPAAQSGYGVPIRKVVKGTEDGLEDAVFGIFEYDASAQNPFSENPIDTLRTDEDGNSYINIPSKVDFNEYKESDFTPVSGSETDVFVEKTYAIKEISAPEGYVIDNDSTYYLIKVREEIVVKDNKEIGGTMRPTHVYTTITTQTYKDGNALDSPEELKVEVQDIYGVDGIVRRIIVIGEDTGADEIYIDLDDATKTILNRISVKGQGDSITRQYIEGYGPSTTIQEEQLVWDGSFPEIERNTFSEIAWNDKQNEQSDITIDSITFYYDNPTTATETEDTNNNTKTKSQTCSIKKFTNVTNNRDNGSDRWWETITINDINDSDKQNITGMKIVYNNTNSDKKGNGIRIKDSEGNYIFGTDGLNALGIEVEGNQTNTVYYGKISTSDAQFVDLSSSNDPEPANVTTNEGSNVHTGSYTYSKTINGHTQTVDVEVPGEAKMATLNMYTQITPTDGMITIGSGENQRTLKYDENKSMILPQPSNPPTFENDYGMKFKKVGKSGDEDNLDIPKGSGGVITLTDITNGDPGTVVEENVIGSSYDVTLKIENNHTYVLHEEQHPDGYETAPDKYFKRVDTTIYYADSEAGLTEADCKSFNIAEGTLTMSDVKVSGAKFNLQKYNEDMKTKLEGAQFRLWNKDKSGNMTLVYPHPGTVEYGDTTETDTFELEDGDFNLIDKFNNGKANPTYVKDGYLQPGHYILEEVTPPTGYQAQDFDFIVKDDLEIQAVGSDYTATVDLPTPDWRNGNKQAYLKTPEGGVLDRDDGYSVSFDNVVSYEVKLRNAGGVKVYCKDTNGTEYKKELQNVTVASETFNTAINIKKFEIQNWDWNTTGWDIEEITITTTDKTYKYTNGSSSGGSSSGSSGATAYNIGKIRAKDTQNGYKFDEVVFYYSSGEVKTQTEVVVQGDQYDNYKNMLNITLDKSSVVGVKITAKNYTGELVITNDSWKAIFNTNYENSVTFAESGTTLTFGSVPTPAPQQAPRKLTPSPAPASISSINGGDLMPVNLMGDGSGYNIINVIFNDQQMNAQVTLTINYNDSTASHTESFYVNSYYFDFLSKNNKVKKSNVSSITVTSDKECKVTIKANSKYDYWKNDDTDSNSDFGTGEGVTVNGTMTFEPSSVPPSKPVIEESKLGIRWNETNKDLVLQDDGEDLGNDNYIPDIKKIKIALNVLRNNPIEIHATDYDDTNNAWLQKEGDVYVLTKDYGSNKDIKKLQLKDSNGRLEYLNYIELIKNDNTSYKYTMSNQKTETEQEDPGSGGGDTTESYNIGEIMFKANDVSQLEVTKITLKYKDGTTKSLTNVAFEAGGQQNEWKIKPEGLPLNDVTNIRIQATGFNGQFVIKENGNDWGPILGTDWNNRSINGEYKYPDDTLGTLGNDDSGANLITGSGNGKINTQSESQTIVIGCEKESDNLYWLTNNTTKLNGNADNDAIKKFTKIEMGFNLIKEHTLQIYGDIVNSNDVKVNSTTNYVYTYECSSNPITLGNIKFQDYSNIMPYLSYIKVTADGTEYTYTNPNAQTEEEETSTPSTPSTPDESSTTTTATNLIVSIATDESGVTYICIPNKMEGDSTEVTVVKNWKDDDCYEGDDINEIRPESIKVQLKRYKQDGIEDDFEPEEKVIATHTLNEDNGWTYKWEKLKGIYTVDGEAAPKDYVYKVVESKSDDDTGNKFDRYDHSPDGEVEAVNGKVTFTNTLRTININVTKKWEGYTEGEVTLPEVKVKLQYKKNKNDTTEEWKDVKHGTEDTYTITLTGSGWSGTFEKLWEGFDYQVVEVDPPQNWTSTGGEVTIEGEGDNKAGNATITNTLKKGSLEITKSWENDKATDRPDKIKVDVYRRTQLPESRISTFGLTQTRKPEDDNYAKLLQYEYDGKPIVQTITKSIGEKNVLKLTDLEGFKIVWTSSNSNVVRIFDTRGGYEVVGNGIAVLTAMAYNEGVAGMSLDSDNVDENGVEVAKITVNVNLTALIPDSTGWTKVGDTIELTSTNGWKYTGQYPVCDENGNNYVYMIKEVTNHAGDTVEGKKGAIYYPVSYTVNTETLMLTPNGDGGYNIKGSTLSEGNTATLKITNKKYDNQGVTMPSAGGTGTRPYTAVGIVIISGAFAAFLITKRRKHDEE